jgi:hypothetical protein
MINNIFESKINSLISDSKFLKLKSLQNQSNLFSNLAVSHLELWHSAFLKWLINPNSDLSLSSFPLKRFLFMIVNQGRVKKENYKVTLDIGDIETLNLSNMIFQNEYSFKNNNDIGKIDIIGMNDELRMIIENKVKSGENKDQTVKYFDYGKSSSENHTYNLFIFLCPDDSIIPKSDHFISVNYQDVCDYVIKPCLEHPKINSEEAYLLTQYLHNLAKPIKGNKVMALPNKELCEKIYQAHKEVLDEIFLSIKGEAPKGKTDKDKIKTFEVTLTKLVDKKVLDISDILWVNYKGKEYTANIEKINDKIEIKFNNNFFFSLTAAGNEITGTNLNGWNFWSAKDKEGKDKGSLSDLRKKV